MQDKLIVLLLICCVVTTILGIIDDGVSRGWIEGFSIFMAIFIVILVTSINNYLNHRQFKALHAISSANYVNVRRGGEIVSIKAENLLVGDIVMLYSGDHIPADGIIMQEYTIYKVDESTITGESELVEKKLGDPNYSPLLISGTMLV